MKTFHVLAGLVLLGTGFVGGRLIAQEGPKESRVTAAAKAKGLPKDIYPDQLARVPLVNRDALSDGDKKIYDGLDGENYASEVGIWSPAGIRLNAANMGALDSSTNQYLRKSALGGSEYEIATLIVAREMNCQVIWTAHEPQALKRGVSREAIDTIKYRKPTAGLSEREATIIQLGREIFEKDQVSSETYAHSEKVLGRENLVILTMIIGYRTGGAQTAKVFDQRLNPNLKPLLPIP
jgi:4-carboxymuconolactone decarboxylase